MLSITIKIIFFFTAFKFIFGFAIFYLNLRLIGDLYVSKRKF